MQASRVGSGFQAGGFALPRQRVLESRRAKARKLHWPVALFLIGLVVPWVFFFGPLRMSVYRIVLLFTLLPCLAMWVTGKAGQIRIADIAVLLYSLWVTVSLTALHGFDAAIQSSGIVFLETVGPYMLARCYIRDADDFYNAVQLLFKIVAFLLPFAIVEFVSGQNILRELFGLFLPTFTGATPTRLELTRVQSVFDHAILFGVFTGSILALVYLVLGFGRDLASRWLMSGIVAATSILSVSSGPLTALAAQVFLLCWNGLLSKLKFRWKLLIALAISVNVAIELIANRSTIDIFVSYFLFDSGSYWFRKFIWMYGTESVLNHPLFGTGLYEWERPMWMGSSIDNFWLFHAVRYGLPAAVLMPLAFFSIFLAVGFKKGLDARLNAYRTGFLITMTAFFMVAWTVHFWEAAYVVFLFLLGSGVWMLDVKPNQRAGLEAQRV